MRADFPYAGQGFRAVIVAAAAGRGAVHLIGGSIKLE
jgi:hypothetical protein